ncbi:MAG: DUF305 domain-containing protein [Corynebacterium marinum]|jgi:uncharacterized protein (DUF305 family)|uniref:DUF305 domain-containing protein n=1 Tax=Corynebacterium marinum TaxID=349751 RepID=A0A847HD78_9CORY|nr:DUF305 domain-containing protein [Corynebacterium marinum]
MKRTTALSALALTSALALASCTDAAEDTATGTTTATTTETAVETTSAEETSSTGASADPDVSAGHNDADVAFAEMMIPHHRQAVDMSETLLAKDGITPEVAEFARKVIDAQGPEIDRMNAMLEAWGQNPVTRAGEMAGHGNMRGMMSEEDMAALDAAEGTEASRLYLEQMIRHHEGAVDMARDEVNDGQNPEAVALAEDIIDAQESEIAEMEQLLQNL